MQRTKGATYERELANQLTTALGQKVVRNIGQARDGGNDIDVTTGAGSFKLEAKRRATLGTAEGWMKQCEAACSLGDIPVVVMRSDGGESLALMKFDDFIQLIGGVV